MVYEDNVGQWQDIILSGDFGSAKAAFTKMGNQIIFKNQEVSFTSSGEAHILLTLPEDIKGAQLVSASIPAFSGTSPFSSLTGSTIRVDLNLSGQTLSASWSYVNSRGDGDRNFVVPINLSSINMTFTN